MKIIFQILLIISISFSFNKSINDKIEEQWIQLFNGKNLDGWINVNTDKTTWRVEDEMIRCTGKPTGLLRTKEVYENLFHQALTSLIAIKALTALFD